MSSTLVSFVRYYCLNVHTDIRQFSTFFTLCIMHALYSLGIHVYVVIKQHTGKGIVDIVDVVIG